MILLLNGLIIIALGIFAASFLRIPGRVAHLLASALCGYAAIILIFLILSIFRALTAPAVFLAEISLLIAALAAWHARGRATLLAPFYEKGWQADLKKDFAGQRLALAAAAGAMLIMGVLLLLTLVTPDAFTDSIAYHFPKIAIWRHNQSIFLPPAVSLAFNDARISVSPPGSEIGYLWVFFWTGTDRVATLIEWLCSAVAMIALYGISLRLTHSRPAAMITACLFPTLGVIQWNMLTATSMMSSLSFLLAGLYFLFLADESASFPDILLASLGISMALGTKETIYYLLPALVVIMLIFMVRGTRRHGRGYLSRWVLAGIPCLVVFGMIPFIQSQISYGSPLAGLRLRTADLSTSTAGPVLDCLTTSYVRYGYDIFVPEPLPPAWKEEAYSRYIAFWQSVTTGMKYSLASDFCQENPFTYSDRIGQGFGILPLLLAGILGAASLFRQKRGDLLWVFVALWASFGLMIGVVQRYHPLNERYFAVPFTFVLLTAVIALTRFRRGKWLLYPLVILSLISGIAFAFRSLAHETARVGGIRPLLTAPLSTVDILPADEVMRADADVVAIFPEWHTGNIVAWGEGYTRDVTVSTCERITEDLATLKPDYFIMTARDMMIDPHTPAPCADSLPAGEYRELAGLLAEAYDPVHIDSTVLYVMVYARTDGDAPVIQNPDGSTFATIQPAFLDRAAAGGLFQNDRILDAARPLFFSLKASAPLTDLPVTIRLFGTPNGDEGSIAVAVYNELGDLISETSIPPIAWDPMNRELTLRLTLTRGLNFISVDEFPAGEAKPEHPLYLNGVSVGEDVCRGGISLSGAGWYGLERMANGFPYRWVSDRAAFTFTVAEVGEYTLSLDAQAGPGNDDQPVSVTLLDEHGAVAGMGTAGPDLTSLSFPLSLEAGEYTYILDIDAAGLTPIPGDARVMNLLVTGLVLAPAP